VTSRVPHVSIFSQQAWPLGPQRHMKLAAPSSHTLSVGINKLQFYFEEFFMPRCSATLDENSVPPWTRGDFRGVLNVGTNPPRRCTPLAQWFDPSLTNTAHSLPRRAAGPGILSSVEEEILFQGSRSCRGAAFPRMKIASPLGQGGLQGGFECRNKPTPALHAAGAVV